MNSETRRTGAWYRVLVITGGCALLAAMAVDLVAVIGRHTGLPLPGSIELVQAAAAIAGSAALLAATINGSHAVVRLLTDRLPAALDRPVRVFTHTFAALFFVALCAGSAWIAADLWYGFEESEIWRIPYRPLRILVCGASAGIAVTLLRQVWRGRR